MSFLTSTPPNSLPKKVSQTPVLFGVTPIHTPTSPTERQDTISLTTQTQDTNVETTPKQNTDANKTKGIADRLMQWLYPETGEIEEIDEDTETEQPTSTAPSVTQLPDAEVRSQTSAPAPVSSKFEQKDADSEYLKAKSVAEAKSVEEADSVKCLVSLLKEDINKIAEKNKTSFQLSQEDSYNTDLENAAKALRKSALPTTEQGYPSTPGTNTQKIAYDKAVNTLHEKYFTPTARSVTSSSHPGAIAPSDQDQEQAEIAELIKNLRRTLLVQASRDNLPTKKIEKRLASDKFFQDSLTKVAKNLHEARKQPGLTYNEDRALYINAMYTLYETHINPQPGGLQDTNDDDGGSLTTVNPLSTTEVQSQAIAPSDQDQEQAEIAEFAESLEQSILTLAREEKIDVDNLKKLLASDNMYQNALQNLAKNLYEESKRPGLADDERSKSLKMLYKQYAITLYGLSVSEKPVGLEEVSVPKEVSAPKAVRFDPRLGDVENNRTLQSEESDPAAIASPKSGGGSVPSSAGQTPLNKQSITTAVDSTQKTKETTSAKNNSKPPATNEPTKTESAEKQNNENQSVWTGYVGTKIGVGAALLAGGIALKLTLIGIVPGLIMAGAGAAIMAWGAVNYMFNNNNEEKKA
jgi:hypothetical protein